MIKDFLDTTPIDYFTKEELERWVESVGGIGAEVIVPEDAYFISYNDVDHIRLIKNINSNVVGYKARIVAIEKNYHNIYYVLFALSNLFYEHLLWHDMRNIRPKKPVILYSKICKRCGLPSREGNGFILCSNSKCASRKQFNKYLSKLPKPKIILGEIKENPIEVRCLDCTQLASAMMGGSQTFFCDQCNKETSFIYEKNKYYKSQNGIFKFVANEIISWRKVD